ncbi:hypothetical protein ACLOJK_040836 [Asimina triloba]
MEEKKNLESQEEGESDGCQDTDSDDEGLSIDGDGASCKGQAAGGCSRRNVPIRTVLLPRKQEGRMEKRECDGNGDGDGDGVGVDEELQAEATEEEESESFVSVVAAAAILQKYHYTRDYESPAAFSGGPHLNSLLPSKTTA